MSVFPNGSVIYSAVGAAQGVAVSSSPFVFTSGGSSNLAIYTYSIAGSLLKTYDATADNSGLHTQVNGLYADGTTKLYASSNNFGGSQHGWILEYDVAGDGTLTLNSVHDVGAILSEACTKYCGFFWVVAHTKHEIHQFTLDWVFMQAHTLTNSNPLTGGTSDGYQGIAFVGSVAIINLHGNNSLAPRADGHRWNGTSFEFVDSYDPPTTGCCQGLFSDPDGSYMWWAERPDPNSTNVGNVVRSDISSTEISGGRSRFRLGVLA